MASLLIHERFLFVATSLTLHLTLTFHIYFLQGQMLASKPIKISHGRKGKGILSVNASDITCTCSKTSCVCFDPKEKERQDKVEGIPTSSHFTYMYINSTSLCRISLWSQLFWILICCHDFSSTFGDCSLFPLLQVVYRKTFFN